MRTLVSIGIAVFFVMVFQFVGGASSQQTNSQTPTSNELPTNKAANIAEENFAKEWKSKFEKTVAELEKHRQLWEENNILNYDFVISKNAPGLVNKWRHLPVLIKIREGEKTAIELASKDQQNQTTDGFENFDTIDKLFKYLRDELDKGKILEVKYDKELGYPKSIVIMFSYKIHGYYGIEISKLKIVR